MRTSATGNLASNRRLLNASYGVKRPITGQTIHLNIKVEHAKAFTMIEIIAVVAIFAIISLSAAISVSAANRALSHQEASKQFIHLEKNTRLLASRFNLPFEIKIDRDDQAIHRRIASEAQLTDSERSTLTKSISVAPFRISRLMIASAQQGKNNDRTIAITGKGHSPSYVIELLDDDANERRLYLIAGLTGQVIKLDTLNEAKKLVNYVRISKGSNVR